MREDNEREAVNEAGHPTYRGALRAYDFVLIPPMFSIRIHYFDDGFPKWDSVHVVSLSKVEFRALFLVRGSVFVHTLAVLGASVDTSNELLGRLPTIKGLVPLPFLTQLNCCDVKSSRQVFRKCCPAFNAFATVS